MLVYKFFFDKQPATSLGLFRIAFGLALLLTFLYNFTDVSLFYSTEGFTAAEYVPSFYRDTRFSLLDYIEQPASVYALYFLFIGVIILFTLGYKTDVMKVALFVLLLSFQERNYLILNSGDTLLRVMSFYLMLSPCGKSLSFDALKRKGKRAAMISLWSVRLMQIQVLIVYFFAGLAKVGKEAWMDGSAVNYIVRNDVFNRFSMEWVTSFPWVVIIITWISFLFIITFPYLIWIEKLRKPMLLFGVLIHGGIFVFVDVGWFSLNILATYALFLKHEEIIKAKNLVLRKIIQQTRSL